MNVLNKQKLTNGLRAKSLLISLALTCSQASANTGTWDDTPWVENCPDGIHPAKSTEQLVNNALLLFEKSSNHQDYGFNNNDFRCYFKKPKILWVKFNNFVGQYSAKKFDDWKYFTITTRVAGQLFELKITKQAIFDTDPVIYWLDVSGIDKSPDDVNLITTMQKYFPNLEAKYNYKSKQSYGLFRYYAAPHADQAEGQKTITGKYRSRKYVLSYYKYMNDGECTSIPGINGRENCSFKEMGNSFDLQLSLRLNKNTTQGQTKKKFNSPKKHK